MGFDTFARNNDKIRDYIEEIERRANQKINNEIKENTNKKAEMQKKDLPRLIELFKSYVGSNKKRFTKQDVELFIIENNIEILLEIKNLLYLNIKTKV